MTTSEERQQVLQMIAAGKITPEEGMRLLAALGATPPVPPDQTSQPEILSLAEQTASAAQLDTTSGFETSGAPEISDAHEQPYTPEQEVISPTPPIDVKPPDTRHWWQVPFWIGLALLVAGAFTLAGALSSGAICLVLLCGLPLLLIGIAAVIVAWFARQGPWVHIRVKHDRPGERNFNLSVPLDLGVMAVRVTEPFVPQMKQTGVDDVILSMKDNVKKDQPLIIDVHDDDDGEHVQVIVG
jgi:hypothetical protein